MILDEERNAAYDTTLLGIDPSFTHYDTVFWQHMGNGFHTANTLYKSIRIGRKARFSPVNGSSKFNAKWDLMVYPGDTLHIDCSFLSDSLNSTAYGTLNLSATQYNNTLSLYKRVLYSKQWQKIYEPIVIEDTLSSISLTLGMVHQGKVTFNGLKLSLGDSVVYNGDDVSMFSPQRGYYSNYGKEHLKKITSDGEAIHIRSRMMYDTLSPLYHKRLTFPHLVDKEILPGVRVVFPSVLLSKEGKTLPEAGQAFDNFHQKLIQYTQKTNFTADSLSVRLGNVANAWTVFKHFYPYREVANIDWDNLLQEAISDAYDDQSKDGFLLTLKKLVSKLHDGHGGVFLTSEHSTELQYPPVRVKYIEDSLVVSDVLGETLLQQGDIISKVNDENVHDIITKHKTLVSAATPEYAIHKVIRDHVLGAKKSLSVKVIRRGKYQSFQLKTPLKRQENFSNYFKVHRSKAFDEIAKGIFYTNFMDYTYNEFTKKIPIVNQGHAFIIDLRGIPKPGWAYLLTHMISATDTSRFFHRPIIMQPDYQSVDFIETGWNLKPATIPLETNTYVLIDHNMMSYTESLCMFLKHYQLATFVGQHTGGTNGNISAFRLPGRYEVRFTGMKVLNGDGSQFHGIGITPDVPVSPTVQGIREGRDEILEKALELATKENQ